MKRALVYSILIVGCAGMGRAAIPTAERQALIDLYNGATGSGWADNTNWRNAGDTDFNDPGTECAWYGVTCNAAGDAVEEIDLPGNGLVGGHPDVHWGFESSCRCQFAKQPGSNRIDPL